MCIPMVWARTATRDKQVRQAVGKLFRHYRGVEVAL